MKVDLSYANAAASALILTPENHGDELQLAALHKCATVEGIDCHRWENENGKGLTFFVGDRDRGQ